MNIFIQILILIIGFALLVKGADWFVDGASWIAEKAGMSKLLVGLTVVAMGTSAPEAAISISASVRGSAGIAVGNILGSNILNIFLILGITAVVTPLAVQRSTVRYEIPFVFFITIIFALLGLGDHVVGRVDGVILWVLFIAYFAYLFFMSKKERKRKADYEGPKDKMKEKPAWLMILLLLIGLAMVVIGSDLVVDSATEIARVIGVSERVIGLTIVAFGTSLPELVTSVAAARKKEVDIAVGNIVGSNIFNILFVIGTASIITPVAYEAKFAFDSLAAVLAIVILWLCIVFHKKRTLQRWGGIVMLVCYAFYFGYLL